MAFSAGVAVVGWLLVMAGLTYETRNLVTPDFAIYTSLSWFMLIFQLALICLHLTVNVLAESLRAFKHTILHLTSIAFVFLVFQFERSVLAAHLYRNLTDGGILPGAASVMTGLSILSLCYLHWIGFLGCLEWFDRDLEDDASEMVQTQRDELDGVTAVASRSNSAASRNNSVASRSNSTLSRKITTSSSKSTGQMEEVEHPSPIKEVVIEGSK